MWIAQFLIRHKWAVLVVLGLLTAAAVALVPRVGFDFTPQVIMAGDARAAYAEAFNETFGYGDAVLLVVVEATGDRDVLHREALTWQAHVAKQLAALGPVERVESVATLSVPRANPAGPPWIVSVPLIARLPVDEADEKRVRQTLEELEIVRGALVSADGKVSAIVLRTAPDARDVDATARLVEAVHGVLQRHPPPAGCTLHLSGLPAVRMDIVDNLKADQRFLLPMAGLLFAVVLGVMFRCVSGTVLPLAAVGAGLAWTFGILVLTGQSLNLISHTLPVLLLVIGVANCVHVVCRYAEEDLRAPGQRVLAAKRTIAHMSVACLLTFGTTAVGFGSLVAARNAVLRSFGWRAGMGIGLLYVSTIAVMGTLLSLFRPPHHRGSATGDTDLIGRAVAATGHAVARHPWITLACCAILVAGALAAARNVVINSYLIETYDEDHPTVRTMRLVEEKLGGFIPLEVSLQAEKPGRFLEPAIYRKVAEAQRFAAARSEILSARSYVDLHQDLYAKATGREDLRDELPGDDEAGRQRLAFSAAVLGQIAQAVQYQAFLTSDGGRARIMLRVADIGTHRMHRLVAALEGKLAELFPPASGIEARLTGDSYVFATGITEFIRDFFITLLGASVVIFALIAILFRSLRLGLIAIVPNVTPLVLTLGYMGLRGLQMTTGNVVVFAVSLGIAVDDTIHFLARFREEITLDGDVAQAIRRAFRGAGRAIVLTSALIVAGLAVLLASEFVPSRRFAELASITMAGALVADLLLLPACLMLFWKRK